MRGCSFLRRYASSSPQRKGGVEGPLRIVAARRRMVSACPLGAARAPRGAPGCGPAGKLGPLSRPEDGVAVAGWPRCPLAPRRRSSSAPPPPPPRWSQPGVWAALCSALRGSSGGGSPPAVVSPPVPAPRSAAGANGAPARTPSGALARDGSNAARPAGRQVPDAKYNFPTIGLVFSYFRGDGWHGVRSSHAVEGGPSLGDGGCGGDGRGCADEWSPLCSGRLRGLFARSARGTAPKRSGGSRSVFCGKGCAGAWRGA